MATACDHLGEDLQITKNTRQVAGAGTCGTLRRYRLDRCALSSFTRAAILQFKSRRPDFTD